MTFTKKELAWLVDAIDTQLDLYRSAGAEDAGVSQEEFDRDVAELSVLFQKLIEALQAA